MRNIHRGQFAQKVEIFQNKIQFGARGQKISPDWIAIDKYDKSPLIDHNYDLHRLPLKDNTIDCIVCNAILEHVEEPLLAIYEMWRVLKIGGQIWAEIPFTQFYHAHPHDYTRVTLPGMKRWMNDFGEVASGIMPNTLAETLKYFDRFHQDLNINLESVNKYRNVVERYVKSEVEKHGETSTIYSGVYFWGEKTSRVPDKSKVEYVNYLKNSYLFDS